MFGADISSIRHILYAFWKRQLSFTTQEYGELTQYFEESCEDPGVARDTKFIRIGESQIICIFYRKSSFWLHNLKIGNIVTS